MAKRDILDELLGPKNSGPKYPAHDPRIDGPVKPKPDPRDQED